MCIPNNINMYVQLNWLIELQLCVNKHHEKFSVKVFCHAVMHRFNFQTVMHRCTNLMAKGERMWLKKSRRERSPASADPVKSCWLVKVYVWYLPLCSKSFLSYSSNKTILDCTFFEWYRLKAYNLSFPNCPPLCYHHQGCKRPYLQNVLFSCIKSGAQRYTTVCLIQKVDHQPTSLTLTQAQRFPVQRRNLENSVTCAASMQMMITYTWASRHYNLGASITASEQELLDFHNV